MSSDIQTRRALRFIVRLWGIVLLGTLAVVAVYLFFAPSASGNPRKNIAKYLKESGFQVHASDIVIAGGLGSTWRDSERPVVFLGARAFGKRLDLWVARMRLSPAGVPLKTDLHNLSSTFLHNEKKAAVSPSWVFWEAPQQAGLYQLVWLPDVRWRLHLHVRPAPESVRLAFDGDFALLEGTVGDRPVRVRVRPETRRVEADGVSADLTVSFTAP